MLRGGDCDCGACRLRHDDLANWVALDAGIAIYALVNSALIIAVVRYWWLDRDEPGEDE